MRPASALAPRLAGLALVWLLLLGAAPRGSIEGRWWGQYAYDDPRRPVVTFSIRFERTAEGKLRGEVDEEISDFGAPTGARRVTAKLFGTFDERTGAVRFLKVYDGDGREVEYRGRLQAGEVRGEWVIPNSRVKGSFFLRRAEAPPTIPAPL